MPCNTASRSPGCSRSGATLRRLRSGGPTPPRDLRSRVDVGNEPSVRDRVARLDGERLQKLDLLARERNRLLSQRRDPERGPSCGTTSGQWRIHRRLEAELLCGRNRPFVLRAGERGLVLERECDTSVEDLCEKEHGVVCPAGDDAVTCPGPPLQVDGAVRASEEDAAAVASVSIAACRAISWRSAFRSVPWLATARSTPRGLARRCDAASCASNPSDTLPPLVANFAVVVRPDYPTA